MLTIANRKWVFSFAAFMLLAACSKTAEEPESVSPLSDTAGLLRYVPADTPYLFAALAPAPDDFMDKMEPKIDQLLTTYRAILQEIVKSESQDVAEENRDPEREARIEGVVEELTTLLSVDGLRSVGLTRDSTTVLYGNGLLPVLRISLSDTALLDDAISRIESRAGYELPVGDIAGKAYRYVDADKVRVIVATLDSQLVVTVMPAGFDDARLQQLLGLTLPGKNLAESGILQAIAEEYDYLPEYIGFISTERLVDTFLDEPTGLNTELLALLNYDASVLSDVCKAEFRSMAAVMPRVITGYEEITVDRIKSSLVIELRQDIATGLATIPAAVPGLGTIYDGLLSFGMSMNLKAAREFYETRLDALEAEPYECEQLADFQQGIAAGRAALNQPLPPIVYDFRGFLAVVKDLQGFDIHRQAPPELIDASFLLAIDNAPALLALGQMASPELAAMTIEPNGEPQKIELPVAQAGIDSAWIALTDTLLAVSLSEDGETALPVLLRSESASPPPFVSVGLDAARYYAMLGEALAQSEDEELSEELQAAIAELLVAAGDFYSRLAVDVRFTARGIEMDVDMMLAE